MLFDDILVVFALDVRFHGVLSWLPVGGADFSVGVHKLEGLDQSDVLIGVSTDWEIVDREVPDDALFVDDAGGSVGHSGVFSVGAKGSVCGGDLVGEV